MATSQFVTYQHTDATIVYQPRVDVEPAEGWRMECDEEIASRLSRPQYKLLDCIGTSRRLTKRRGASLSFTIFGGSFKIIGSAIGGTFSVRVGDGREQVHGPVNATNGVLFEAAGLGSGAHLVTLTSTSDTTELRFENVDFDAGLRSNYTTAIIGARYSNLWTYSPSWVPLNNPVLDPNDKVDDALTQRVMIARNAGAKASLKFRGNSIWLIGNMMSQHSRFTVSLASPESPTLPAVTRTDTFSSVSNYTVAAAIVYFNGGLDPRVEHTLTLQTLDSAPFDLLHAMVVTGDPPIIETASPIPVPRLGGSQIAKIVGCLLAGVFAVVASGLLFRYIMRRRRLALGAPSTSNGSITTPIFLLPNGRPTSITPKMGARATKKENMYGTPPSAVVLQHWTWRPAANVGIKGQATGTLPPSYRAGPSLV